MVEPTALPIGTNLGKRYSIEDVLGRGGFAITYLARDLRYDLPVVIKELAPQGSTRERSLRIEFHGDHSNAMRLMGQFREEVATLRRVQSKGIIRPIDAFDALGTSYLVLPYFQGSTTAEELILNGGPMNPVAAEEMFEQLLRTLADVHEQGILHRDIKPSNILVSSEGDVFLIDFGSARQWLQDITQRQTIEFTPGFAALEQLSENARRGPGTDLYGLSSTMVYILTGKVPPGPGEDLGELLVAVPGIREEFRAAIYAGLELRLHDRPKSAKEMLKLLEPPLPNPILNASYDELDGLLRVARAVKIDVRECPSCLGVLTMPTPAKRATCIVCRTGKIHARSFDSRICPGCKLGILHRKDNLRSLRYCPTCHIGHLHRKAKFLRKGWLECEACNASFQEVHGGLEDASGTTKSPEEWREQSGRASATWECDQCEVQLDEAEDGRWSLVHPLGGEFSVLYPEEWARIAAGTSPGAGNVLCEGCGAEYFSEGDRFTLTHFEKDSYGVGEIYLGRVLHRDHLPWIAAGKSSGEPGVVCEDCNTEFDDDGENLKLVWTPNPELASYSDQSFERKTWRKLALKLPTPDREEEYEDRIEVLLKGAFASGEILEGEFWRGIVVTNGESRPIHATTEGITIGKLLRKTHYPWSHLTKIIATEDTIVEVHHASGEISEWEIEPQEIVLQLQNGQRSLSLTAHEFAARCNALTYQSGTA